MENFTMLQFFEWYFPANSSLWNHFKDQAPHLKGIGIDTVWLPPAHKGTEGASSSGYDAYDIYDLGEFDQKGSVATKYGTKEELIAAIAVGKESGLQIYADIVLNHMGGADEKETIIVRKVNPENRNEFISEAYEIEGYTKFTFPGRNGKYSEFVWDFQCFSGVDYDDRTGETAIFSIQNEYGEGWQDVPDKEHGNYDYLMLSDVDFRNPNVMEELKHWGKWFYETTGINGFRLDAIKHMPHWFYNEWLDYMRGEFKQEFFTVGEYWAPYDLEAMIKYIEVTGRRMSLFDAPLQANFHEASKLGGEFNLSEILKGSLVSVYPELAVTLVENHDTQPLQSLENPVEAWFRPLAYALILLRTGGYPCVFYTDLYGSEYTDAGKDGEDHKVTLEKMVDIDVMLQVRKHFAYGEQFDYFDHPNCIGWTRQGDEDHENSGCAVLMSNGEAAQKMMHMGPKFAGKIFKNALCNEEDRVKIDDNGDGAFTVNEGKVSIWVLAEN
ncbi:alpha-amylase [Pedobacter frigoris]|uniref:alpha-amylase n=1 Tax=Pedobacter frigoris TaxID=2571272 RepID=UPI00292D7035|nr:alpha-amylase [Pedobacter frigoris]